MYIAALRIADDFGCDAIGIQYQQGLKDCCRRRDLVEGTAEQRRPSAGRSRDGNGRVLYEGEPLPHFNEVDECAGLDGLMTYRIWTALGYRSGEHAARPALGRADRQRQSRFVWVFVISAARRRRRISSAARRARSASASRRCTFRLGGGTLKGISKPGEIVWSRVFVDDGKLKMDLGRAKVVELPQEETERRWQITTPQWPIMHAVTYGVTRDQMMARHKANHIQVAYAPDAAGANQALAAKAAMFRAMGLDVSVCGTEHGL